MPSYFTHRKQPIAIWEGIVKTKRKEMQATQVTGLSREFHRPNPLEGWFASSFLCDMNFLDQA